MRLSVGDFIKHNGDVLEIVKEERQSYIIPKLFLVRSPDGVKFYVGLNKGTVKIDASEFLAHSL